MKRILRNSLGLILLALLGPRAIAQQAFKVNAAGKWSDVTIWNDKATGLPATRIPNGPSDTVYIETHAVELDIDSIEVNALLFSSGRVFADSSANFHLIISSESERGISGSTQNAQLGVPGRSGGISLLFENNTKGIPNFGISNTFRLKIWVKNLYVNGDVSFQDTVNITGALFPRSGLIKTNDRLVLRAISDKQYGQISGVGSGTFEGLITAEMQIHGGASWRQYGSPFDAPLSELNDDISLSYEGGPFNPNTWNTYNWREDRVGNRFLVGQSLTSDSFKVDGTWTVFTQATPAPRLPRTMPFVLDIRGNYRGNGDFSLKNRSFSEATAGTFDTLGVHHISNPYPSCVRWVADNHTNVQGNAYAVWREHVGSFGFYNGVLGTNGADDIIPPFTTMYIKVNDANNEILFKNTDRTIANRSYFSAGKDAPQNLVRLSFSGNNRADEVILYSQAGANMGWGSEDVFKIYNGNFYLNAFTLLNDTIPTAISIMDTLSADSQKFRIIFVTDQEGNYTLNATLENADTARGYWMYDYETGDTFSLSSSPYSFSHKKTNAGHRFDLIAGKRREAPVDSSGNGLTILRPDDLKIWANEGQIYVDAGSRLLEGSLEIFSLDGKLLETWPLNTQQSKQSISFNNSASPLVIVRWNAYGGGSKVLYFR